MDLYPGANSFAGNSPVRWCNAWALMALPGRPLTAAELSPWRTLHAAAPLAWQGEAASAVQLGLAVVAAEVSFVQLPDVEPQTIAAVALVAPDHPEWLVAVVPLDAPLTTTRLKPVAVLSLEYAALAPYDVQAAAEGVA